MKNKVCYAYAERMIYVCTYVRLYGVGCVGGDILCLFLRHNQPFNRRPFRNRFAFR